MCQRLLLLLLGVAAAVAAGPSRSQTAAPTLPPTKVTGARSWLGKWVWTPGEPAPRNSYTYFRKTLQLDSVPKETKVHLTADSRYVLWVNGAQVGRGPARSDRRWLYYDTWDLAPHLKKGKNVLAVLVHHYGEWTFQYMQGRGGLIADVAAFAGRTLARTDTSWKALRAAAWTPTPERMSIQLGFNEVYDAREEPLGWRNTDFDDGKWPQAVEIGPAGMEPWPNLVARDIPAMREEPARAKSVIETAQVESAAGTQHVDLLPLMEPKTWGSAYLATTLVSPDKRDVELRFGSDDALKVWLNGTVVVSRLIDRGAAPDQDTVRVTLNPGPNRLLARVVQGHSKWEFYFRLAGAAAGVKQTGAQAGFDTAPGGPLWWVAGPYPFPMGPTLKAGFDAVHSPERGWLPGAERATDDAGSGAAVRWREVTAKPVQFIHVSQQMQAAARRPLSRVQTRDAEKLIERGTTPAWVKTAPDAGASFLVDFGKEVTGFPRFRVRGARGGEVIELGYGEVLQGPGGEFIPQAADPAPLLIRPGRGGTARLNPDRDGVHYADRYVCRPGEQEWQTFDKRAFRYMQVDVRDAPEGIEIDGVGVLFSTFPVQYKGAFECSDERLNRIWEIGRYTCQLNMEDAYTDCPWRERAQWWGDARVEALINYYCFGDTSLIRKALRQKGQSLNAEGITWGVYPTEWDGGRLPSFTLIWISQLWETYLYTGDREIVAELLPKARYSLDRFFAPRVGPQGLLKDVPYWVFIDWAPVDDKGQPGALNAYYYDALRATAEMARLLDDKPAAAEYARRAQAVRDAMNQQLWDAQAHAYRDSLLPDGKLSPKISQQTNSLCVLFDIAPKMEHARILDYVYAPENKGKVVEAGSPYFSYYQLAALYHAGRHQQALAYIRERWGRMLDWGATVWWEMWTPGASFCHGWSGGPTYNLPSEVLGVKPLKPGFAEVSVAPQWLGLRYATGIVPTAKGDVKVGWQRDERGNTAALRVDLPPGVPAEVTLPDGGTVLVNKKATLPAGVTRLPSPPGNPRYRVERPGATLFELAGTR